MAPARQISPQFAQIEDGDVLLFRGRSLISRLIAKAGRGRYSHAGIAAWWHGVLMCVEVREGAGGRATTLSSVVDTNSGQVDWYAVRGDGATNWDYDIAVDAVVSMIRMTGRGYGWRWLLRLLLSKCLCLRWLIKTNTNDEHKSPLLPVCSAAVSAAWREAGIDLVPNLADAWTEPSDLARSGLLEFRGTLVADCK